jgi:hypothetical protein
VQKVGVDTLTLDPRLQHRLDSRDSADCANPERAAEYAVAIEAGTFDLQPIRVVQQGRTRWVWSGFHTLAAQVQLGKQRVQAEVTEGTFGDALLLSCSAGTGNTRHGAPYQAGDKRALLLALYALPEWHSKSLPEVAKHTGFSQRWCQQVRSEAPDPGISSTVLENQDPGAATTSDDGAEGNGTEEEAPQRRRRGRPAGPSRGNGRGHRGRRQAAAPESVTDELGAEVPERLRDVFASETLPAVVESLEGLKARYQSAASWNREIRLAWVNERIDELVEHTRNAIPHAVCPECEGAEDVDCNLCSGVGYLTEPEHTNLVN